MHGAAGPSWGGTEELSCTGLGHHPAGRGKQNLFHTAIDALKKKKIKKKISLEWFGYWVFNY